MIIIIIIIIIGRNASGTALRWFAGALHFLCSTFDLSTKNDQNLTSVFLCSGDMIEAFHFLTAIKNGE